MKIFRLSVFFAVPLFLFSCGTSPTPQNNSASETEKPKKVKSGAQIYEFQCASCHGNAGQGAVGPNLTDRFSLHGDDSLNIYKIVSEGVPAKGMMSYKSVLKPEEIANVTSYVLELQGSNPPNPKEPQGNPY